MVGPSRTAIVSVPTVAIAHGLASVAALLAAAVAAGGRSPALPGGPLGGSGSTAIAWLVVGVGAVALVGLVASTIRAGPSFRRRAGPRFAATLEEPEVRAVLERWYPEWDARYRTRVAEAISYHRRPGGPDD